MRYTTREPEDSKNIRIKKINQNYSFGFWEGKPSHNHSASSWKSTMKESAILQRQEESIFTQYNKRQASKMSQKSYSNLNILFRFSQFWVKIKKLPRRTSKRKVNLILIYLLNLYYLFY